MQQAKTFTGYVRLLERNPQLHTLQTYKQMIADRITLGASAFYDYCIEVRHDG